METAPAFEALRAAMAERQIEWRDIRQIVLTHMHPDHMGMAARLLKLTGAELAMHQAEADHLRLVTSGNRRIPWLQEAYIQSGVPLSLETKMEEHFSTIRESFHPLDPGRLFAGGEKLETALGPLEVVWTSGHSPDISASIRASENCCSLATRFWRTSHPISPGIPAATCWRSFWIRSRRWPCSTSI